MEANLIASEEFFFYQAVGFQATRIIWDLNSGKNCTSTTSITAWQGISMVTKSVVVANPPCNRIQWPRKPWPCDTDITENKVDLQPESMA